MAELMQTSVSITRKILCSALMAAALSVAAQPAKAGSRDDIGLVLGALGGGVLGHQIGEGKGNTWATAVGAVTGAVLGQSIGGSLDRAERGYRGDYGRNIRWQQPAPVFYDAPVQEVYYAPAYEHRVGRRARHEHFYAAPVNYNYVNYNRGYQRPQPYFGPADNYYASQCREFTSTVTVGNRMQESYGTACLQPDGSWKIVQ